MTAAPEEIKIELEKWRKQVFWLRLFHGILIMTIIIASVIVASKPSNLSEGILEWVAITTAIATGILASFGVGGKANQMRTGWRILHAAIIQYESDPSKYPIDKLMEAYRTAQKIIGDVKEDPRV